MLAKEDHRSAFFKLSTTPWRRIAVVKLQFHSFFDLRTRWRISYKYSQLIAWPFKPRAHPDEFHS